MTVLSLNLMRRHVPPSLGAFQHTYKKKSSILFFHEWQVVTGRACQAWQRDGVWRRAWGQGKSQTCFRMEADQETVPCLDVFSQPPLPRASQLTLFMHCHAGRLTSSRPLSRSFSISFFSCPTFSFSLSPRALSACPAYRRVEAWPSLLRNPWQSIIYSRWE